MKGYLHSTALCLALSHFNVMADAKEDFHTAYANYQQSLEGSAAEQLKWAERSYRHGLEYFGDNSLNSANLGLNYAITLSNEQNLSAARDVYKEVIEILSDVEPLDSLLIYQTTKSLIALTIHPNDIYNHYQLGIDALKNSHSAALAQLRLDFFQDIVGTYEYNPYVFDQLKAALSYFEANLADNHPTLIQARFAAGKVYESIEKYQLAEPLLLKVVQQFEAVEAMNDMELETHALLVALYEEQGLSDKATKHCQAIGKKQPWQANRKAKPLYRKLKKFSEAQRQTYSASSVSLRFTIDEQGFVVDPVITKKGTRQLTKMALESITKWRYAPRYKNGVPVKSKSGTTITFGPKRQ